MDNLKRFMKVASVVAVVAILAPAAYAGTTTTAITVPNFSFESGSGTAIPDGSVSINGGDSNDDILADWNLYGAAWTWEGRLDPSETQFTGAGDPNDLPSPADSVQCAYLKWGTGTWYNTAGWSTITSSAALATVEANSDYVLNVAVGSPLNNYVNVSAMRTRILVGGSNVAETTSPIPAKGAWDNSTVTLTKETIAANPSWVDQDITIQLTARTAGGTVVSAPGATICFDNVRLNEVEYTVSNDLTIKKFFDCNLDDTKNGEDIYLSGWQFNITDGGSYNEDHTTDVNGEINLIGLAAGDYDVTETVKGTGWVLSGANPRIVSVSGTTEVGFGNQLPGDANQDEKVNLADFTILKAHFGDDPAGWVFGNFNTDTTVNLADFTILKASFGLGAPSAGGVPEPATMGLLAIGALGLLRRRRKG